MTSRKYGKVLERLGDAEPTTVDDVRAILEGICVSKGYLDEDYRLDLENLSPEHRDRTLYINEKQRKLEAAFTKSVSQQLYSSKYRFLYELVQNADDSLYGKARRRSEQPFLRFRITPSTFIAETNEDGFRRANVEAVCATGESSKKASAADDHIGEKGFGFKSVFSVAKEVHIQSGLWSFRFQHRQGDDGLGMVTPLNADAVILPADVTTRITLHLTKSATADYQGLLNAVASMPESTIFFLQRLHRLHIHVTNLDAKVIATTFETTAVDTQRTRVLLKRCQKINGRTAIDESLYRCFAHVVDNMPEHEHRKNRKSARIELAFPVEPATKKPKLSKSGQHVFAYLPLLRLQQIQFIIQSDFVTSANRESVIDCAWNTSIFKGVAKTFAMAVESFTKEDDLLRYSWLDYLPTELNDDRWEILCPLIVEELARRPILQTWRHRFKKPGELLLLPSYMLCDSEPILKDLPDDVYLASDYEPYMSKVESLGVRRASLSSMIKRLEVDIVRAQKSRVRTKDPDDLWHVAFAALFSRAWTAKQPAVSVQEKLKRLAIIPLQSRLQWTGALGQIGGGGQKNVYFSETDGNSIPNSIALRLLDTQASTNQTRKAFYKLLGVEECPHELVVEKINQMHLSTDGILDVESHLEYLFYANEDPESVKSWVRVPTNQGTYVTQSSKLYFPSEGRDDLHRLLDGIDPSEFNEIVVFLDESLVELETESTNEEGLTWQAWLQQATGARYHPPLLHWNTNKSSFELSPVLKALNNCRPRRLLRALRAHWHDYEKDAPKIEADLKAMRVRCMVAANESSRRAALEYTYLPTANVIDRALELGLSPIEFDILDLPDRRKTTDKLDDAGYRRWRFLEDFGVRRQPDLDFYKRALEIISMKSKDPDFEVLKEIYASIAKCTTVDGHADLCEFFEEGLLWIPSSKTWEDRSWCNWRGPPFLEHRKVLHPHYGHDPILTTFFKNILNVTDTSISDVMDELQCCRRRFGLSTSLTVAGEIYEYLNSNASGDKDWESIMEFFREGDYILGKKDTWHKLETCVWQTPFLLSGYHELSSTYPQLESFFVKRLKVKKVTPGMLVDEITKMVNKKTPKYDRIRKRLIDVGMVLAKTELDEATRNALDALVESQFLPKRSADGNTTLLAVLDNYAIADHTRYASAFAEQNILLDFSVEEVHIMNVMFEHIGVKKRYLSSLVVEESTVEDGAEEDDDLSHQLQAKSYALYCCATKYKSVKALRGDCTLFETLSTARVLKGDLATHLVIDKRDLDFQSKVRSDRSFIHHEITEGSLKLYVPEHHKQRSTCYRSQLPKLLAEIMEIDSTACHDISVIIESDLRALEDVLVEHDITIVSWIEQPVLDISDIEDSVTSSPRSQYMLDAANPDMRRRASTISSTGSMSPSESTLVDYAASSSMQIISNPRVSRSSNQADHDRHNGALGEAFVFEELSALNLADFTRNNWRSTIRGELSRYHGYAGIANWEGRETADIVYKDCDGRLTRWLKGNCTGGYPAGFRNRDFAEHPIEYYFEVKSTTGACGSRFFLSTGQYKLMREMTIQTGQLPTRIYVIMRVFNVLSDDKELKIFVDPVRLEGIHVEFEVEGWTGRIL
ncbi:uncharacterized protein ALTATR162_LOCUS10314 [Alternaria atra]|uniref:Protein NO VEIN C-terminal domain-containing protein n=1 Tax=Alternaria atra TaxID=119953 RepID=A0A8J2IB17_9PLEO|nr:uncharacterized protein ALTATR162_LOCUS10314 [Alternaria atra]CAG5182746.1 unnamed protein product [Alternaria atra]